MTLSVRGDSTDSMSQTTPSVIVEYARHSFLKLLPANGEILGNRVDRDGILERVRRLVAVVAVSRWVLAHGEADFGVWVHYRRAGHRTQCAATWYAVQHNAYLAKRFSDPVGVHTARAVCGGCGEIEVPAQNDFAISGQYLPVIETAPAALILIVGILRYS